MRAREPQPLYCVYRAGDLSITCYRAVSQDPAPLADFLSFIDLSTSFIWWDLHRAAGISAWEKPEQAAALARRKGYPLLAQIDLSRADPELRWARTGARGHITMWGSPPHLLQAVVTYIPTGK